MWGRTLQFLPRSKDREGLLPWVIGVMLFLSALAIASAMAIGSGIDRWSQGLASNLTVQVQVIVSDADERTRQTDAVLRLLRATPGVESADLLASADVMALVSPWLGDLPIDANLPIPDLIDVTLDGGTPVDSAALAERLKVAAPGAELDDHQAWLGQILDLAAAVQLLLFAVVIMVVLSTIAIVIFGCRAGLATHAEPIAIMHLMGAEDSMICRAFDMRYLGHGIKGGVVGIVFALLTLWLISRMAAELGEGLVSAFAPTTDFAFWLLLMPLFCRHAYHVDSAPDCAARAQGNDVGASGGRQKNILTVSTWPNTCWLYCLVACRLPAVSRGLAYTTQHAITRCSGWHCRADRQWRQAGLPLLNCLQTKKASAC